MFCLKCHVSEIISNITHALFWESVLRWYSHNFLSYAFFSVILQTTRTKLLKHCLHANRILILKMDFSTPVFRWKFSCSCFILFLNDFQKFFRIFSKVKTSIILVNVIAIEIFQKKLQILKLVKHQIIIQLPFKVITVISSIKLCFHHWNMP